MNRAVAGLLLLSSMLTAPARAQDSVRVEVRTRQVPVVDSILRYYYTTAAPPRPDTVVSEPPPPPATGCGAAVWCDDFRYSNTAALIASSKYAGAGDTRNASNISLVTGQTSYDGTVRPFARYKGAAGQFTRATNGPVNKTDLWIELSSRISTNFPSGCGGFQEVKFMLVVGWEHKIRLGEPSRFNLELFNQCARYVLGYPSTGDTEAQWVRNHPFKLNDGKWHIWRFHFRGSPCLAAFAIDGKLIESQTCPAQNGAAQEYQWGLPYINAPSSGYVDYGHRAIYTTDPGWGF